jgi:hypothetical protein
MNRRSCAVVQLVRGVSAGALDPLARAPGPSAAGGVEWPAAPFGGWASACGESATAEAGEPVPRDTIDGALGTAGSVSRARAARASSTACDTVTGSAAGDGPAGRGSITSRASPAGGAEGASGVAVAGRAGRADGYGCGCRPWRPRRLIERSCGGRWPPRSGSSSWALGGRSGRRPGSADDTPAGHPAPDPGGQPCTMSRSRGASLRTIGPSSPHTTMSSIRAP